MKIIQKDPQEDLDYTWDFSELLQEDEAIASFSFPVAPDDPAMHDTAGSDKAVTGWVGPGGDVGTAYDFTCRIVTDSETPRTFERTIRLDMVQK